MQLNFAGKKALVRVDFNVPLDKQNQVTDDTRIREALPTIQHILNNGGSVILMSHFGRPLAKLNEDGTINKAKFSLRNIVDTCSKLIGKPVIFAEDCVGQLAENAAKNLQAGQVLLLENTRFHAEEEKGDEAFAKQLASLGDVFINDAFGSAHRAHASTTVVAKFFDKSAKSFGFLMEKELTNASKVLNAPNRPLTAIIGGAKVSDKILLLDRLVDFVDNLIIGGGMAYTFYKAQGGQIGNSLCETDKLQLALDLLKKAESKGVKVYLPAHSIVADKFAADANTQIAPSGQIPDGWMGLDISPEEAQKFSDVIMASNTIFWNGPMGVFEMEAFAAGTKAVANAVANATQTKGAFSLIGGGDSVAAINLMKLNDKVSYISTGGGAMLEFMEGKTLPGVKAIEE
jgi:phosphoglycerate kinase